MKHGGQHEADVPGLLKRACGLGFQPGCENADRVKRGEEPQDAPPTVADYRVLLSLFKLSQLASSQQNELDAQGPSEIYAEACRRGWTAACGQ
jgi:hypothetical protein